MKKRCKGFVATGERCKRAAVLGLNGYCRVHSGGRPRRHPVSPKPTGLGKFVKDTGPYIGWGVSIIKIIETIISHVGPYLNQLERKQLDKISHYPPIRARRLLKLWYFRLDPELKQKLRTPSARLAKKKNLRKSNQSIHPRGF
jgi:hypothetical protein